MKHAVWLYNRVPNHSSGLNPLELLTKTKADHRDLLRAHVWGCPAIVLEPQLQNDQKLPKWNRRARVGQFLGYSDEHLSLMVVFSQFHVVFDNLFKTVVRTGENDAVINSICDCLFERNRELYVKDEFDANGMLVYKPPPLHKVWLDEAGHRQGKEDFFGSVAGMRILCVHSRKKLKNVWDQLQCCPLLQRISFPREPPSPMMIVWFLLFTANIQNQREILGMMMTNDYGGFVHVPQPPPAPNLANEGAGAHLVPEGEESVQAHEGAAVPPAPNFG